MARDGQRLERLQDGLRFFAPEREVLVFPAWDCLPYDRLSPHPDIVAERLETLARLAAPRKPGAPGRIILASVGAALQKVPPRSLYAEAAVVLRKGQTLDVDWLTKFLGENGYGRVGDRDGAGRVRRARRPGRSLPAGHIRAAAARPVRRHAGGDPLVRCHEPALDRHARGGRPAAGKRGAADEGKHRALPRRLSRAVRQCRGRRCALRGGVGRPAPCRHGALAAAVP